MKNKRIEQYLLYFSVHSMLTWSRGVEICYYKYYVLDFIHRLVFI
jgi:hypothetical protein